MKTIIESIKRKIDKKQFNHLEELDSDYNLISLTEYEEIVGIFKGIIKDARNISVIISGFQIKFNLESAEGRTIEKSLNNCSIGEEIALLRTDLANKPIIVKRNRPW